MRERFYEEVSSCIPMYKSFDASAPELFLAVHI